MGINIHETLSFVQYPNPAFSCGTLVCADPPIFFTHVTNTRGPEGALPFVYARAVSYSPNRTAFACVCPGVLGKS